MNQCYRVVVVFRAEENGNQSSRFHAAADLYFDAFQRVRPLSRRDARVRERRRTILITISYNTENEFVGDIFRTKLTDVTNCLHGSCFTRNSTPATNFEFNAIGL